MEENKAAVQDAPNRKIVKRKQRFEEGDFKLLPDNYSCKLNNELGSMVA